MSTPFNRDAFNTSNLRRVANGVMGVLNAVQDMRPEEQLASIGAALVLYAEQYDISPGDAFAACTNMVVHGDSRRPEFGAVQLYLRDYHGVHRSYFRRSI